MSIAHSTWDLLPKRKRPADIILDDILDEDESLYKDAAEYVKEETVDLVDEVADDVGGWLEELLKKYIVPVAEIGGVLLLGLIVIENVI